MPEISFCFFDMKYLLKLFPKMNDEVKDGLVHFEQTMENEMAQNRTKLFDEFNYEGEFQKI